MEANWKYQVVTWHYVTGYKSTSEDLDFDIGMKLWNALGAGEFDDVAPIGEFCSIERVAK